MNLTWHIVKKDLRRMALPVGAWVALVVATTVAFRLVLLDAHGNGPAEVTAWATTMSIWTRLLVVGEFVMAGLLAAALILEDGLRGTNAFWMTRPIPPARLLAAKLTAAALLFIAAPTVGLMVVWFACGLGWQGVLGAAVEFAFWQAVVIFPAVTIASLAGTLAEFLFCAVGLGVGFVVAVFVGFYLAGPFAQNTPAAVDHSRSILIVVGVVPAIALMLAHQYLTRRTVRTWLIVGMVGVALVLVRVAWPWEWDVWTVMAAQAEQLSHVERPEDRSAEIVVQSLSRWNRSENQYTNLKVTAPWTSSGFYMPVLAWVDHGATGFSVFNGWQQAGERAIGEGAAGFSAEKSPVTWRLEAERLRNELLPIEGKPALTGELEIWWARARILGEMPLREGGELSNGPVHTRIVGFLRTGEQLDGIFVEEHDVQPVKTTQLRPDFTGVRGGVAGLADHLDCYFLVDRAKHRTQWLAIWDLGARSVRMNSLTLIMQRLFVGGTTSWDGAVVVVMRIERDHAFTRPFAVQGITYEHEEEKKK